MIDMPTKSQCTPTAPTPTPSRKTRTWPAIVGGVVGGVALIVIVFAIVWFIRWNKPIDESDSSQNIDKPTDNSRDAPIPVAVHSAGGGEKYK